MALRREGIRAGSGLEVMRQAIRAWDEGEAQELELEPVEVTIRRPGQEPLKVMQYGRRDPPVVAAQRKALRRRQLELDALYAAADALERCGRDMLAWRCSRGHLHHTPRWCGLATLCPDCARHESGRLAEQYTKRVQAVLARGIKGLRPRLVTLALRPRATETLEDAFERCRGHGRRVLRVLYGVPVSAADWRLYRAVFPLTERELEAAGGKSRAAWAMRRRQVRAARLRTGAGWLVASEFGERGMKAHVHALVVGRFVSQRTLVRAWHLATGDSFMADVRAARNVLEVVKYPVKHMARAPHELAALYRVTAGRRRIEAYGTLRSRCPAELATQPAKVCPECGQPAEAIGIVHEHLFRQGVRAPPVPFRGTGPP